MSATPRALATYRLQMNREFRFEDARALVAYFNRLGITHAYTSPLLRARSGSLHGYDVVDPRTVNPAIGDETSFRSFVATLQAHGLGLLVDIVPNHMSASTENDYWEHVLMYGPSSPYARWFDIDWRMPHPELWGRVLVPILGESLSRVLAQDQIKVYWVDGRFRVQYYEHSFPLDPATLPLLCRFGLPELRSALRAGHPALAEIEGVLAQLAELPGRAARARGRREMPLETSEELLAQLAQSIEFSPQTHEWAQATAERFGEGAAGQKRLSKLLKRQNYRLVHWRKAARILNYRRFFDINDLISVRQEDPDVFQETHAVIARWWNEGLIDGVRIDHIDGLRDPLGYLLRLQELFDLQEDTDRDAVVYVEKILARDEFLPESWPVAGTTGYEFLNAVEALFVSAEGFEEIEQTYRRLIGRPMHFERVAKWGKRRILKADLSAFVGRLADMLNRLAQTEPEAASLTRKEHVDAIVEYCVALERYRTYLDTRGEMSDADRNAMQAAIQAARETERATPPALAFLERVLLNDGLSGNEGQPQERINFVERLQQLTGPAAAKGVEDTALYAYVPLVSLNEVGGEPDVDLTVAVNKFHDFQIQQQQRHPRGMLCVTTHDTKRSADVRARLDVLSEWPKLWDAYVTRWRSWNRPFRTRVDDRLAPDPATEYLFYQSLVGIWPAHRLRAETGLPTTDELNRLQERLCEYLLKAIREAKTRTNWTSGDPAFEEAVLNFVRQLMSCEREESQRFLEDVYGLVQRIAFPGFWNSLSRTMIQLTAPGNPDLYQGDEFWNFTLVDPDNRQAVDFESRQAVLNDLIVQFDDEPAHREQLIANLLATPEDGRIKLHTLRTALLARRDYSELFASGCYQPLKVEGEHAEHVVCYLRESEGVAALVVAPRLVAGLTVHETSAPIGTDVWQNTEIQLDEKWSHVDWQSQCTRNYHTPGPRGRLPVAEVLKTFPVALLIASKI